MLSRRGFLKTLFATAAAAAVLVNPAAALAPVMEKTTEAVKFLLVDKYLAQWVEAWNNPPPSLEWTPEGARKRMGLDKPLEWRVI